MNINKKFDHFIITAFNINRGTWYKKGRMLNVEYLKQRLVPKSIELNEENITVDLNFKS